jgi:uncharacterized damage-inducible protein DinB
MSSIFSNTGGATAATAAAPAYTRALLELLGNQNPLDILGVQTAEIARLTRDMTTEELRRPEASGKWSVLQVLDHLTDAEMVSGSRIRFVVAEDNPTILAYDQDLWSAQLRYGTADLESLLSELAAFRSRNLRLLRDLAPAELERVGQHSERGPESVGHMMKLMAAHDLVHRRQIARIRGAFGKPA